MAKKEFDLVLLTIGYEKFAVPKAAALQFLDLCVGNDVYKMESQWHGGEHTLHAILLEQERMPSISVIGPVQFHQALANHEAYVAQKAAEKKASGG
jgi:hypothetical protein